MANKRLSESGSPKFSDTVQTYQLCLLPPRNIMYSSFLLTGREGGGEAIHVETTFTRSGMSASGK